jgi:general secretion pathway protein E
MSVLNKNSVGTAGAAQESINDVPEGVTPEMHAHLSSLEKAVEGDRKTFLMNMTDADLLTSAQGEVPVSEDDRRRIAVFSNGVCAISPNSRWSPDNKAVLTKVRRAGHQVRYFLEVDTAFMVELYEAYDKSLGKAPEADAVPEVERQRKLKELIGLAASRKASDIHMRVLRRYTEVKIRVFGRVQEVGSMPPDEGMAVMQAAFSVASDVGENSSVMSFQQGALNPKSGVLPPGIDMLRLQYSPTSEGRGALIARLKFATPADEVEIDSLGYNDDQIRDIITFRRRTNGLYILAGKVSSGKTTTLQRTLNKMYLEKNKEISMFTIEEPVELELPGAIQCPVKKKPDGTDGFEEAIKSALRSDPNIIVVGEIRSQITAYLAIQAVMTGHALWSTVHAGYALGILDRLTDLGVESWKLEDPGIVRGLIYQRLCGVICKDCRLTLNEAVERGRVKEELAEQMVEIFDQSRDELYARGPGCSNCKMGLSGRTVVAETVPTDPHLLELYSKGKRREMFQYWVKPVEEGGLGGRPVMHHALTKVGCGLLDIDEVEEEVDLVSEYIKNYSNLYPRLRDDVAQLKKTLK